MAAAVMIACIPSSEGPRILFELRAQTIDIQPGEVSLPGGHIERGETPRQAVVRELCEELLLEPSQVEIVQDLGEVPGPGGAIRVFAGWIHRYEGSFSTAEVERVYSVPVSWFLEHEPAIFQIDENEATSEAFPWERIPGGRSYPFVLRNIDIPFYLQTEPLIWGFTARVIQRNITKLNLT